MSTPALNALEMFNQLVQQGLIVPALNYPDLTLPTAYRTVPTMTAGGTAVTTPIRGVGSAKLDSSSKGNSENTGPR